MAGTRVNGSMAAAVAAATAAPLHARLACGLTCDGVLILDRGLLEERSSARSFACAPAQEGSWTPPRPARDKQSVADIVDATMKLPPATALPPSLPRALRLRPTAGPDHSRPPL